MADGSCKTPFTLQCRDNRTLTIRADNGCYIKGEQNGLFRAKGTEVDASVLWEY
jgi:fascin 1/2